MAETGVLASVRAFDRKKRKNSVYFLLTFEDIPGLGSVESVHVGDRHGGVRQGAAFVEVATVYARDQRRLHVVPVGARDPVAAAGGGATRISRGAGVAAGRGNDVQDDPVAAPALKRTEVKTVKPSENPEFFLENLLCL